MIICLQWKNTEIKKKINFLFVIKTGVTGECQREYNNFDSLKMTTILMVGQAIGIVKGE